MARNRNETTEEAAVFAPDALLPVQYVATLSNRKGWVEGEKRLIAAVLTDAIDCYMKHYRPADSRSRQLFVDAETWIFDDAAGGLFSFRGICDLLGLEADYIRRGLTEWRRQRDPSFDPRRRPASEADDYELKAAG
ncbi:MAG: hypothetical protein ACREQ9_27325 [Candidatus Binatia bacterium]